MLEEWQVANEVPEDGPSRSKALMDKLGVGKALRASAPKCLLLLPVFFGICHGVNGCGGIPTVFNVYDYLKEISHSTGHYYL